MSKGATCQKCGETGLAWGMVEGKWRLHGAKLDAGGKPVLIARTVQIRGADKVLYLREPDWNRLHNCGGQR